MTDSMSQLISTVFNNQIIEDNMKFLKNIYFFIAVLLSITLSSNLAFAQGGNNNAFFFNGTTSQVYVNDGPFSSGAANSDADQTGFQFFKSGYLCLKNIFLMIPI